MKRLALASCLLAAIGCGKVGLPGAGHHASAEGAATEEFEGKIDLFGQHLRARREVKLDTDGNYVKHGKAVAWYENGQKAGEMAFVNDKPHGTTHAWYESGKKKWVGESKDGLAVGVWTEWYENGQKQAEGAYMEGERHGNWTFWEQDGQIVEVVEYRGGKKINVVERPQVNR
jgi:hypothetical protein